MLSGKGFVGLNKVMTTECWFRKLIDNIDALKRAVQRAFEQGQVPFLTKEETAILKTPCYTVKKTGKLMNFLVNLWPVLHSIENKALLSMIKALRKAGFDLCLPVYDGGLVVKPGVDAATLTQEMESLLPQIEQAILDDTQVPMKLKIKGLDPAWISPDPDNGDDADDDVDDDADGDDEMEVAADDQGKPGLDTDRPTYPPGYQKSFPGNLFTYPTDPVTTFQHDELAKFVMDELSRQLRFHFRTDTLYVFKEESKLWRALSGPTMYMGELMELVSHLCPPLTYYIDENNVQKYRDKIGSIHTLQSVAETIKNKIKFHRQAGPAEDMQLERDFAMIGCMPLLGNRVLDLRTGLTRTRTQSDFFTTELPVQLLEHDQVDHEWTQAYIKSLLGTDDDHYVRVFCEAIGYMFTGEFDLKYFFMFVGPADSGKSLLISLLRDMLGDDWFLAATDPKVIVKGAESAHNAELVPLIGKRGAAISELEACQKFNESRLKALVSGEDAISVRGCGEAKTHLHYFRIVLLMMTNHVPKFDDHALASRLRVFAFPNRFARSSDKKAEIKSHINDLFYYFVQGAKQYYANGRQLSPCPQVDAATQRIVDSKCTVLNWFAESEFTFDPCNGKEVRKLDLFGSYQKWCRDPANRDLITKELGRTSFYERVVEIFQPMFDAGKQNEQLVFHNRGDKTFRGFQLRNQD